MEEYVVQYDDTLRNIAEKKLGDKNRWQEIAQLNNLVNTNELFIGQKLKLPPAKINILSNITTPPSSSFFDNLSEQIPASLAPARGFMFVIFEQLPNVGSNKVIRKVAVIPKDWSLVAKNPFANVTPAEHALGNNNSQFLSTSNKPFASPTMSKKTLLNPNGWQELLLIDTNKVMASGARIITVEQLVADLRRHALTQPYNEGLQKQVNNLIRTIEKAEGETLIEGGISGDFVKKVSNTHSRFILTADEIWSRFEAGKIPRLQMETELEALGKSYSRARVIGKMGRVVTVVGVVFTAVEVANAAQKSYSKRSYKPLAAETVRQVSGWSGAYTGGIAGAWVGGALGVETGPGLIITGAIGAMIFGAIGYWRGDVIAGWIDPPEETLMELQKDVNYVEGMRNRQIPLVVGKDETQYDLGRRALMTAAVEAQKRAFRMVDSNLPARFADKFYPINANSETKKNFQMSWVTGDPSNDGKSDIKPTEWKSEQGNTFTYHLNDSQIDELIRMMFNLSR